jgi:hypothetical protein
MKPEKVATVWNLYSHQLKTNLSSLPAFYSLHKRQNFSSTFSIRLNQFTHPEDADNMFIQTAGTLNNTVLFYKILMIYRPVSSSSVHATSHQYVSIQKRAKFNEVIFTLGKQYEAEVYWQ